MDFHPVEENLRHLFRILASRRDSGEVRELPGVSVAALGSSFQMFNAVFLNAPVADEADFVHRVTLASVHMQARGLPWAFWICEDWLPLRLRRRASRLMQRLGLSLAAEMPGMTAERIRPPKRPLPTLDIRRVSNEPLRQAFCQIGAVCFHVPLSWFEEIFDERTVERDACSAWVAYADGQPVATAATISAASVIGVYNVATLPPFRERGIGEAVTRFAIADAKRACGLDRTVLQATRHGLPLYQRMGYSSVTRLVVFTS